MSGNLFLQYLQSDPRFFWAVCFTVVLSVCLHELSHGVAAIWLGDRTPIETGHMTLNPMRHMGGMSLILLLVAGIAWGMMPVNPSRLRGRHGRALVAAAGPACNVLLAAISLAALGLWQRSDSSFVAPSDHVTNARFFLWVFGAVNVSLAIFNLIPVPPLDGSRILADLSPNFGQMMAQLRQGGQLSIVFLLLFMFAGQFITPLSAHIAKGFLQRIRGW
jgi:Zn-dependent protease